MKKFVIIDEATCEELQDYARNLEDEIEALEDDLSIKQKEIDELTLTSQQLERLEEAAEWAVERGVIHNTSAAKRAWIEGR